MFCQSCGKQINDNAAFCTYCGAKVGYAQGTPNRANTPPVYNNAPRFNSPGGKKFTSKPVFWIVVAVALIILIVVINDLSAPNRTESQQYYQPGWMPTLQELQSPAPSIQLTPSTPSSSRDRRIHSFCNGTGQVYGGDSADYAGNALRSWCGICQGNYYPHYHKKCMGCNGTGYDL